MIVTKTPLKECFIIEPKIFRDDKGYFFESFNKAVFEEKTGLNIDFVQDNKVFSNRGVLRGLHFQKVKDEQAKLVRVIKGKAVDVRLGSKTFGKCFSIVLSEENKKQLFVPRGFAHGYSVLENNTIFSYKCDNYYNQSAEGGGVYKDASLNIDWMLEKDEIILSEKDKKLKPLK